MALVRTTDTVAAFVRWRGMLLLLKRSDAVRSFRGLWHGVSGSVEGDARELGRVDGAVDGEAVVALGRGGARLRLRCERGGCWEQDEERHAVPECSRCCVAAIKTLRSRCLKRHSSPHWHCLPQFLKLPQLGYRRG